MKPIIIFDGECNFCNFYINKLISIDKSTIFFFTSYSSKTAKKLLEQHHLPPDFRDSFILSINNSYFMKSNAIIQILLKLGFFWKLLGGLLFLIPKSWRDFIYDYIAKNRYKISKRYNSCQIPTSETRARFLS